jgi:1-acyl-sn-glycerol-3-phosphate acyltransferase
MSKEGSYLRAARRMALAAAGIPWVVAMAMLQGLVVGPLFKNHTAIPNLVFNTARRILGFKVVLNEETAPLVRDRPAWFLSNHIVAEDIVVVGSKLPGVFVGMAELTKWPIMKQITRAVKFVPVKRNPKYSAETRGSIIQNFNEGSNIIMFPEAEATPSQEVHLFRAGLMTALFNQKSVDENGNPVSLQQDVAVQPVALKIKAVNGKELEGPDDPRREFYAIDRGPDAERKVGPMFRMLAAKNITLELKVLPPLNPRSFPDAKALANQAARDVASVVNPGQTTFKKARISTNF